MYNVLADLVVLIHFTFILFVIFGGLLILLWPKIIWLHVPALSWGVATQMFGLICPLTPFEIYLRNRADMEGYSGGFIENYLIPVIYPAALTHQLQWALGTVLLIFNVLIYVYLWKRSRTVRATEPGHRQKESE